MIQAFTDSRGSVVVVAVAILLLLSLLALTYITVMEIEVSSNEAFQFGIKADMVVNWVISDACALIQSTVRNVGIYEDPDGRVAGVPHAVWSGVDYDSRASTFAEKRPMQWAHVPHNWYSPPYADFRRYDFDCYNMFIGEDDDHDGKVDEDAVNGIDDDGDGSIDEDPAKGPFFGYISPEGPIFGESSTRMWWGYHAYDLDLLNIDGDFDFQTHRQARWRTFRNPDPTVGDTWSIWDNVYARSAGLVISTQKMLYLGEYRGDYINRNTGPEGHHRIPGVRPLGYNLSCYKPNAMADPTHQGQERVDRDKLTPSPNCSGNSVIQGPNILNNGMDADCWPDITAWHGGEGMMNINALIRMLSHLVNERAAVAIAKHRPYRTKQHILQAVDAEGATLTTTEYARLMANVTCHANYDPVTGFCPLNINKVRSPQSICPQWCVGPDPLLDATYDRDITNYLPNDSYKYRYKMITFQEYIDDDAPIPTKKKVKDDLSIWDIKRIWKGGGDSEYYNVALWDVLYPGGVDHGDFDPATGSYYTSSANGTRVTNRLLWGAFSCIPSLVITSATTNSPHVSMHYDGYWLRMAAYAEREYNQVLDKTDGTAPQMVSDRIRNRFTPADVLQTVIGLIQSATGGKLSCTPANPYHMGSGARVWINDVHPVYTVFNNGAGGYAPGMGRLIPNSTNPTSTGEDVPGVMGYVVDDRADAGSHRWYWGWSPVQQGSGAYLSECYHSDGTHTGNPSGTNAMENIWATGLGRFIEDMDRFEEIIAWMAPFHPVANPHGRSIITERQANDILNNFIDFRDNIKDPNNLLTDWKLHSQEYDRGNYEAYKAGDIAKDGYLYYNGSDTSRLNTVCSMGNWTVKNSTECKFPDAGEDQGSASVKAKVPYLYIREPYFHAEAYDRDPKLDKEGDLYVDEGNYLNVPYFKAGINQGLDWEDRLGLAKGESIIEINWNVSSHDDGSVAALMGYGDPEIRQRLESHIDGAYPWVNELEHQEYNIIGIGKGDAALKGQYQNVSWIRNHGFASLNWTKDWIAFNYHRNHHKKDEYRRIVFYPNAADGVNTEYPEDADFIAEGYRGIAADGDELDPNADYDAAFDSHTENDLQVSNIAVDDYGHVEKLHRYYYYESPGLMFGPDRIPDAYQTLNKGHILVDLSKYYQVDAVEHIQNHTEDVLPPIGVFTPDTEDTYIKNGICDTWTTKYWTYHYSTSVGETRRFSDFKDGNGNWIPDSWVKPPTAPVDIGSDCLSDAKISQYDRAFNQFIYNCTDSDRKLLNTPEYIYGYEHSSSENTDNSFMDADCKLMTFVGYRGSEVTDNDDWQFVKGRSWGDAQGGSFAPHGRFDLKTDSPYFHGTAVRARKTRANSLSTFSSLVTLYNKPYLYDVPMRSPSASLAGGNITFTYSYNYGRNIYAYDFDGNAIALKNSQENASPKMEQDLECRSMFYATEKLIKINDGTNTVDGLEFKKVNYGEKGCVAGSGGRIAMGPAAKGYHLPTAATSEFPTGTMNDIVPRFNPVEPFFDPMYPNGRLFYRRLMTCGDTTIVLDNNYKNGPDTDFSDGRLVDDYDPMDFSMYKSTNIYKTVESRHVKHEDDVTKNPFITDGGGGAPGVNTETWPVAAASDDSRFETHWNHVFNAYYSIPTDGPNSLEPCADSAWSVPFTTRDRFYEIHVRAEIVNTDLSELGMYRGVSDSGTGGKWMGWRGHEILASKQAVAIFDRGWRWAYWDDDINQPCPYYDPFRMVGSRPGVDTAIESGVSMPPAYEGMIYDNEMCTYYDWVLNGPGGKCYFDRASNTSRVKAGYIAPAEYSGVNRPGDDCAERARIVFFRWTGITQ